jgi:hypothetical protein
MGDWRHNSGSYPLSQVEGVLVFAHGLLHPQGYELQHPSSRRLGGLSEPCSVGLVNVFAQHLQVTNVLEIWSLLSWCNMRLPPRLKTALISIPFHPPTHHPISSHSSGVEMKNQLTNIFIMEQR